MMLSMLLMLPTSVWSLDIEEIGYWATGNFEDIAPHHEFVYLAVGLRGMDVIETGGQAEPKRLVTLDLPGEAHAIAMDDAHAYVAAGSAGLQVVAISTPESPTRVAQLTLNGDAHRIVVDGNLVAVLAMLDDTHSYLHLVDVSQPNAPRLLSTKEVVSSSDLALRDGLLYLAGSNGLQIINVINHATPNVIGRLNSISGATDMALHGDYVYILDRLSHLYVVNIARSNAPFEVAHLSIGGGLGGRALRMAVADTRVYVSRAGSPRWGGGGVSIIDVSNPENPQQIGQAQSPPGSGFSGGMRIASGALAVQEQTLYAVQDTGLALYATAMPATEDPLPITALYAATAKSVARDLVFADYRVFLANGLDGLRVFSVDDPRVPVPLARFSGFPSEITKVSTNGELASIARAGQPDPYGYVHDFSKDVLDVREPGEIERMSRINGSRQAYAAITGSLGFDLSETTLVVNDLTDPAAITELSRLGIGVTVQDVTVVGNQAYIPTNSGLTIVDFSNPRVPGVLGSIELGAASRVAVDAGIGYVVGDTHLWVVDITTPQQPRLQSTLELVASATDIAATNGMVFVAQGEAGLSVIDVRDPIQPQLAKRYDSPGSVNAVVTNNDWLYLADGINGLSLLRVWREPTVFRFYNTATKPHFYTSDPQERDKIVAESAVLHDEGAVFAVREFIDEGIAYYAFPNASDGTISLYRFFNPETGAHFFTASEAPGGQELLSQAVTWFNRAAEQGDAAAQKTLGMLHACGYGVPQSGEQAEAWFARALEPGDDVTATEVAEFYDQGFAWFDCSPNVQKAVVWYRRAAEAGNTKAQSRLQELFTLAADKAQRQAKQKP